MSHQSDDLPAAPLIVQAERTPLGDLILGLVFFGFIVQQLVVQKSPGSGFLYLFFFILFMQAMSILTWLWPPRIELAGGLLRLRLFPTQKALQTLATNIAELGVINQTLVVRFHDLDAVANLNPTQKKQCQANAAKTSFHVLLGGGRFSVEQANLIRPRLGLELQTASPIDQQLQAFEDRLREVTPQAWSTQLLLVANLAVFVAMQFRELSLFEPSIRQLLDWGGNFGPKTTGGQWWRLLTYQFVHAGVLHLLFNSSVLKQIGPTAERLLGSKLFLVGYLFSGVCGGLCSSYWSPTRVSVGASGAIFGLFGIILGLLARHHRSFPMELVRQHRSSVVMFVVFNVFFAFSIQGIDTACHLGGLAGGFLFGLAIVPTYMIGTKAMRAGQLMLVIAGSLVISVVGFRQLVPTGDLSVAMQRAFVVEMDVVKSFQLILTSYNEKQLSAEKAAEEIRERVIAPWRVARQEFSRLPAVPLRVRDKYESLASYMQLREESWDLFAQAIEQNSRLLEGEATLKAEAAFEALERAEGPGSAKPGKTSLDFWTELSVLSALESHAMNLWQELLDSHKESKIDDAELATRIRSDVLPKFELARSRFLKNAPLAAGNDPAIIAAMSHYLDAKHNLMKAQAKALETNNSDDQAQQQDAERELEKAQEIMSHTIQQRQDGLQSVE